MDPSLQLRPVGALRCDARTGRTTVGRVPIHHKEGSQHRDCSQQRCSKSETDIGNFFRFSFFLFFFSSASFPFSLFCCSPLKRNFDTEVPTVRRQLQAVTKTKFPGVSCLGAEGVVTSVISSRGLHVSLWRRVSLTRFWGLWQTSFPSFLGL